jgi:hypothetical protein
LEDLQQQQRLKICSPETLGVAAPGMLIVL